MSRYHEFLKDFEYNKVPDNKPWAYICSKGSFGGFIFQELIFEGAYYWREFCVLHWVGLYINNS